ncbi:hypothetical protein BGW36DRAFT_300350 [Talaromyces proteolyticus]|uniref:Uncharacterized protein n=1 Tax=Talaromyces proteolyticus TaxID=1131652 RepID=A0AAD4KLB9_9EURO|nr:uncharacterized protein BGW36DRAFT_300350 [Talaromyces proteolyticus]KAH8693771.1 hypothetical protein BGW36DRAFT_300350 [Talaromyces proteolyticus]
MLVILSAFNDKPQPSWKYMSLNSLISWLSTLSKGCILFAINETLGQLKWVWFAQKTRPVPHLRSFDEASRGFWGSAQLIWELKGRHFAVLGSIAVILGLGLDPFAQNLVNYYQKMVVDSSQTALAANSSLYNTIGPLMNNDSKYSLVLYVDPVLKANVYNSIFNLDQQKPWSIAQYICSSSNCTWGPIASLEYQASCADVTDKLNISTTTVESNTNGLKGMENITLSLSDNSTMAWFLYNFGFSSPVVVSSPLKPLVYTNTLAIQYIAPTGMTSLAGYSFGIPIFNESTTWVATECTLYPIVRSFNASVQNGKYKETTISTWSNKGPYDWKGGYTLQPPWGPEMGVQPNQTFVIEETAMAAINDFLVNLFNGRVIGDWERLMFQTGGLQMYAASDVIQTLTMGNITGCNSYETAEKLNCSMSNVATAISKTLRDSAYVSAGSNSRNASMASGKAMSAVTYVTVHWEWVSLSIVVWVLGAAMLVGTILKTQQAHAPKWKNDPMPLLFLYRGQLAEKDIFTGPRQLKLKLYGNHDGTAAGSGDTLRGRTYTFNE